jgi:hypothetical protein
MATSVYGKTFQLILVVSIYYCLLPCMQVDKLGRCFYERYLKLYIHFVIHYKFQISGQIGECSVLKGNFYNSARLLKPLSCTFTEAAVVRETRVKTQRNLIQDVLFILWTLLVVSPMACALQFIFNILTRYGNSKDSVKLILFFCELL